MSDSVKQIPHTTVESTIFHKSNLLTSFHGVKPRRGLVIIRTIFSQPATARIARRFYRHVLSKQRSCPLYHGILINTGVGNPTASPKRRLWNKQIYQASGEAQDPCCLYKGDKDSLFHPRLLLPCPSILAHSSSSAQVRIFSVKPLQTCPEREASGWSPSLRRRTS